MANAEIKNFRNAGDWREFMDNLSPEQKAAVNIGEQMSGKILCPRACVEGQELSTFGDWPWLLFCPHCELEVEIIVKID